MVTLLLAMSWLLNKAAVQTLPANL